MPEKDLISQLWGLLPAIAISTFGGLVRALRTSCTFKSACVAMIVAAFTGVVVSLFLQDVDFLSAAQKAAVTGIASYSGGTLLDILSARTCNLAKNFEKVK